MFGERQNPYPLSSYLGKIVLYTGDRGLTVIGRCAFLGNEPTLGSPVIVFEPGSFCIRRWGTDAGLGQLIEGPRPETILDVFSRAPVALPLIGTVSYFPVRQSTWREKFPAVAAKEDWDD